MVPRNIYLCVYLSTVDDLAPRLPLWEFFVQDLRQGLHGADPARGTCPIAVDHADCTTPTRQHELDLLPAVGRVHKIENISVLRGI